VARVTRLRWAILLVVQQGPRRLPSPPSTAAPNHNQARGNSNRFSRTVWREQLVSVGRAAVL